MARTNIDFSGKTGEFDAAAKSVVKTLEDVKRLAIGAFGVEGVKSFTENTFALASSLVASARGMKTTIENVQVLKKVAEETGTEFEALESAIGKVAIAREKALKGDKDEMKKFTDLGINQSQMKNNDSVGLLFKNIGDKVKNSDFDSIAAPLEAVVGKGFEKVMPALEENIDGVRKSMEDMGEIMDTKTAVSLKVLGDSFKALSNTILVGLAPTILTLTETMTTAIAKIGGETAGLSAAAGTMYAQIFDEHKLKPGGTWKIIKGAVDGMNGDYADMEKNRKEAGLDDKEIKKAFDGAEKPFTDFITKIKNEIAKISKEIGKDSNGKSDSFTVTKKKGPVERAASGKGFYSDALTSSGNMLGSSFSNINAVATQVQLSQQQLYQQKLQTDLLRLIAIKQGNPPNPFAPFEQ